MTNIKELSIEQKAKRYDEAIEIAKKWRNAPNVDKIPTFANRVIEEIFPELAESEDERIRKANEAPEKIYLQPLENNEIYNHWYTLKLNNDFIEYTRTDAFIERAADWITRNGSYYIGFEQGQPCIDKDFIEDFKNYMKGE